MDYNKFILRTREDITAEEKENVIIKEKTINLWVDDELKRLQELAQDEQ
jgi:hypothetical protein